MEKPPSGPRENSIILSLTTLKAFHFLGNSDEKITKLKNIQQKLNGDIEYCIDRIERELGNKLSETQKNKIKHAYLFAAIAHRGQTRGDNKTPYMQHCVRASISTTYVCKNLYTQDKVVDSIVTMILHDTPEDTKDDNDFREYNKYILSNFNQKVYDDIKELTKPDLSDYITGKITKIKAKVDRGQDYIINQVKNTRICKIIDNIDFYATSEGLSPEQLRDKSDNYTKYILEWGDKDEKYKIDCMALVLVMKRAGVNIDKKYSHTNKELQEAKKRANKSWALAREAHVTQSIDDKGDIVRFREDDERGTKQYPFYKLRKYYRNEADKKLK